MANGITGQVTAFDATIGAQAGGQGSVTLDGGELLVANADGRLQHPGRRRRRCRQPRDREWQRSRRRRRPGDHRQHDQRQQQRPAHCRRQPPAAAAGSESAATARCWSYGNAVVGGAAGAGAVTVGESADDTALFALIGTLAIDATGQVTLGGANATVRASAIDVAAGGLDLRRRHAVGRRRRQRHRDARQHRQRRLDRGERRQPAALRRRHRAPARSRSPPARR